MSWLMTNESTFTLSLVTWGKELRHCAHLSSLKQHFVEECQVLAKQQVCHSMHFLGIPPENVIVDELQLMLKNFDRIEGLILQVIKSGQARTLFYTLCLWLLLISGIQRIAAILECFLMINLPVRLRLYRVADKWEWTSLLRREKKLLPRKLPDHFHNILPPENVESTKSLWKKILWTWYHYNYYWHLTQRRLDTSVQRMMVKFEFAFSSPWTELPEPEPSTQSHKRPRTQTFFGVSAPFSFIVVTFRTTLVSLCPVYLSLPSMDFSRILVFVIHRPKDERAPYLAAENCWKDWMAGRLLLFSMRSQV